MNKPTGDTWRGWKRKRRRERERRGLPPVTNWDAEWEAAKNELPSPPKVPARKRRYQKIQEFRSTHEKAESTLLSEEPKKYDPDATTEDLIADLRRVQESKPDAYITRKMYRRLGKYSDSTWDAKFGTFAEFRRQARLELSRGQQALEKQIAKHASLDTRRGFAEVEILPWVGRYERDHAGRWKTQLVGSDFHDKEADPFTLGVFLETADRIRPDIITFAGDLYDMMEFSRFDKDPRQWDAAGRLAFVRDEIFRPLRESCPDAQIDLLAGNHEHHLLRHMSERTPEMRAILSDFMGLTLSDMLGLKEFEINLICRHDLAAFSPRAVRTEIQKNRKTYFGCVTVDHYPDRGFRCGTNWLAGHTHKPGLDTGANEVLGGLWGHTMGCVAHVDNSYTSNNRNQNGFAIVHYETTKKAASVEPIIFNDYGTVVAGVRYSRDTAVDNAAPKAL